MQLVQLFSAKSNELNHLSVHGRGDGSTNQVKGYSKEIFRTINVS